jgi:DNA-binding CsgD family transcriptional regulator
VLVGRDRELQELAGWLAGGRRVVLLGEAGIGKTALVRAAAQIARVRLREGGALATLSWMPYLPIERALGRTVPAGDAPYIAAEVDRRLDGDTLFLDDLHWADGATQSLLPLLGSETRIVLAVRRGDPATQAALELAASLGAELLPVEPLAEDAACALVERLRPSLPAAAVRTVVRRAAGNPLLLEELPASGEATESLRRSIAARLRHLDADAGAALGLIALAGRPLPRTLLGPAADVLVEASLAVPAGRRLALRHALLAEAVAGDLSPDERVTLHRRLAEAIRDPGESARHYAAAGALQEAHARAMRAASRASTPGERAEHLALAASCASGSEAEILSLRASRALCEAGRHSAAVSTLERIEGTAPGIAAEAALLRWQALHALGEVVGARKAWEAAIALADQAPVEIGVRLRVEQAAATMALDRDPQLALVQARAAMRLASAKRVHRGRARFLLGRAAFAAGASGWERNLRRALDEAQAEQDHDLVQAAGAVLAFGLLISGRLRRARIVTESLVEEARSLRLTGPERRLRARLAGIDWHAGRSRRAVDACDALLQERLEPGEAFSVRFYLAEALIDQAGYDRGRRVLDELRAVAPGDRGSLEHLLWVEADLELWSGRARHALAAADRCLDGQALPSEGPHVFVRLARSWACLDLGVDPGEPRLRPTYGMGEAAPFEEQALSALARQEHDHAAELFADAARLWQGRQARGLVRCLLGRGEALRLAGRLAEARTALEKAELAAERRECVAVLARIRRSLRLAGEHRVAARTRGRDVLTGREEEILALVGGGLSNAEIARRLGISRATVERLVSTASRKLGVRSRLQAATLAARW